MRVNRAATWLWGGLRSSQSAVDSPTFKQSWKAADDAAAKESVPRRSAARGWRHAAVNSSCAYEGLVQPADDELDLLGTSPTQHHHSKSVQKSVAHSAGQQPASPSPVEEQTKRSKRDDRNFPTAQEVRQVLKHSTNGCGSSKIGGSKSLAEEQPELNWRQIVAAARSQSPEGSGNAVLTDSFQRKHSYLRISLTERCNLRCLYCMPEGGVELTPQDKLLTTPEIMRLAALFAKEGVTKIRLTGGEPTIRKDIVQLTAELAAIPGVEAVGITTNGIALQRKLSALKANGLTLLNLSLDTLKEARFEQMTRRRGLSRVLDTIHQAVALGFNPVKVNVVVMRGQNDDEILDFVEMTRKLPLNVRFIEYMPFDGNVWSNDKLVPYAELAAQINEHYSAGLQRLQDPSGEVAKNFRIPGFAGTVSFVTSMTSAFCGDCNRLRLMADGNLKVCLFGANEVSLRDAMREGATDTELAAVISAAVNRKKAAHAGMLAIAATPNRSMVRIGG